MRSVTYGTFVFLAFMVGAISIEADAQTTRAKAKPLATPPPVLTAAEIISRADDYPETSAVAAKPQEKAGEQPTVSNAARIKELNERIKKLEAGQKNDYDEQQKRLKGNIEIIFLAEQRSESLRKQLFEMIEKENFVKARLDQIEYDIRPEAIERALQLAGSMRPEEVRESRRKSLDAERRNLQSLLIEIQNRRANINFNLQKADLMVEKLRTKLEKDIDESILKDDNDPRDPSL